MKLVVDSNIVIASLIRDGVTRNLLMECPIQFVGPEHMLAELRKHRRTICKKSGLAEMEFNLLIALVTERIKIVERSVYEGHLPEASAQIGRRDPGDVPFLALALSCGAGIWTYNTKHFEGSSAQVWSTADVAAWARSAQG